MAIEQSQFIVTYSVESAQAEAAIARMSQRLKQAEQQLNSSRSATDKSTDSTQRLERSTERVATALSKTRGASGRARQGIQIVAAGSKVTTRSMLQLNKELGQYARASRIVGPSSRRIGEAMSIAQRRATGAGQSFDKMNLTFGSFLRQASKFAAGYALIYGVIRLGTTAVTSSVQQLDQLERSFRRAQTVTRASSEAFQDLCDAALDFGASRGKIFQTAEALFALGSAGLTAEEQLAGLPAVMNTAIGLNSDLEETAKLVAGAYNVFGESLEEAATTSERFTKIADILTFTYTSQQVELEELRSALEFVTAQASLADIEFGDLVTIIGFLNTNMLRGSKAGISLNQSLLVMAKNAEKLRTEFGIVFDPTKPLNILDVFDQLSDSIGDSASSLENQAKLSAVFGKRGVRAIALIVKEWDKVSESIEKANETAAGFAVKTRDIVERSFGGGLQRGISVISVGGIQDALRIQQDVAEPINTFVDSLDDLLQRRRDLPTMTRQLGRLFEVITPGPGAGFVFTELQRLLNRVPSGTPTIDEGVSDSDAQQKAAEEAVDQRVRLTVAERLSVTTSQQKVDLLGIENDLIRRIVSQAVPAFQKLDELNSSISQSNARNLDSQKELLTIQKIQTNSVEDLKNEYASVINVTDRVVKINQALAQITKTLTDEAGRFATAIQKTQLQGVVDLRRLAGVSPVELARDQLFIASRLGSESSRLLNTKRAQLELEKAILGQVKAQESAVQGNVDVIERLVSELDKAFFRSDKGALEELIRFATGQSGVSGLGQRARERLGEFFPEEERSRQVIEDLRQRGLIERNRPIDRARGLDVQRELSDAQREADRLTKVFLTQTIQNNVDVPVSIEATFDTEEILRKIRTELRAALTGPDFRKRVRSVIEGIN